MQPKDPLRMERASAEPVSLEPPVQGSPSPAQPNTRHEAKPCSEQPLQPPLTQRHLYSKHETPGCPPPTATPNHTARILPAGPVLHTDIITCPQRALCKCLGLL